MGCTRRPREYKPSVSRRLNIKTVFLRYGILMLKMGRPRDRLILNTGIPLLVRQHIYIKTATWMSLRSHLHIGLLGHYRTGCQLWNTTLWHSTYIYADKPTTFITFPGTNRSSAITNPYNKVLNVHRFYWTFEQYVINSLTLISK